MQKVSEFKIVSASEGGGVLGGTLSQAWENEVCGLDAIQGMLGGRPIWFVSVMCEIIFLDARALAEHKRRKNHKDRE